MRMFRIPLIVVFCFLLLSVLLVAQTEPTPAPAPGAQAEQQAAPSSSAPAISTVSSGPPPRLTIGIGDEGDVSVYGNTDLNQHFRVTEGGDITLPLVGRVQIAGLTAEEAQSLIEKKYVEGRFLNNPHVTVAIKEYTSQGVTVLGEVTRPGTYSAMHVRRLYDAFSAAGGMTQRAGSTVAISHRNQAGEPQVIKLSNDAVQSAKNNIDLEPGDTVVVSRAGVIYVVGEVVRPGGFVIENPAGMTASQVLAMASGPTRTAKLSKAQLIRKTPQGLENKTLDLKKVMSAQAADIPLQAEDILYVPASSGKMALDRGANSALSMITSLALYRF